MLGVHQRVNLTGQSYAPTSLRFRRQVTLIVSVFMISTTHRQPVLSAANVIAVVLALVIFALPYEYCMDGNGYGFPLAWYHPGHGEWGTVEIDRGQKISDVLDLVNLFGSMVLWSFMVGFGRWLSKSISKNAERNE